MCARQPGQSGGSPPLPGAFLEEPQTPSRGRRRAASAWLVLGSMCFVLFEQQREVAPAQFSPTYWMFSAKQKLKENVSVLDMPSALLYCCYLIHRHTKGFDRNLNLAFAAFALLQLFRLIITVCFLLLCLFCFLKYCSTTHQIWLLEQLEMSLVWRAGR